VDLTRGGGYSEEIQKAMLETIGEVIKKGVWLIMVKKEAKYVMTASRIRQGIKPQLEEMAVEEEIEKGIIIMDKKKVEYVMAPCLVMHGNRKKRSRHTPRDSIRDRFYSHGE
jgi:GTP1/Obg family GTP-binding protein